MQAVHAAVAAGQVRRPQPRLVAGGTDVAQVDVTLDPVEFEFNFPAVLRQTAPVAAEYETGVFTGR